MQKNVLKESFKELGVYDGDVLMVETDKGFDYYQFKENKLIRLNSERLEEMEDCDIFDLLSGGTYFKIIARGNDRQLDIEENVEDIKSHTYETYNKLSDFYYDIKEYIKTQKEKEEKQKKDNFISGCICWGVIVLLAILIALIG